MGKTVSVPLHISPACLFTDCNGSPYITSGCLSEWTEKNQGLIHYDKIWMWWNPRHTEQGLYECIFRASPSTVPSCSSALTAFTVDLKTAEDFFHYRETSTKHRYQKQLSNNLSLIAPIKSVCSRSS